MSSLSIESAMKNAQSFKFAPVKVEFSQSLGILRHKSLEEAMKAITTAQTLQFSNNVKGLAFGAEQATNSDGVETPSTQPFGEVAQVFSQNANTESVAINSASVLTQVTLELTKEGLENYERLMKSISDAWKTGTLSPTNLKIDSVGSPQIKLSQPQNIEPIKDADGRVRYQFSPRPS